MTSTGVIWLTIPVENKGKYYQKINETKVLNHEWADKHWKSIQYNYARAAYFSEYEERIHNVYEICKKENYLSRINYP